MDHAPVADRIEPAPAPAPAGPGTAPVVDPALAAAVRADRAAIAGLAALVASQPGPTVSQQPAVVHRDVEADVATCPIPGVSALGSSCPVMSSPDGVRRSPADLVVRKVLRIKERPPGVSAASAYSTFQRSMLISATRCTLTYVVFPFVLPAAGFASGVGPIIGIVIGTLALVCDTFTIRRFFAVDHKWRWHFSAIAFSIMCLLSVLLVQDLSHVVGSLIS